MIPRRRTLFALAAVSWLACPQPHAARAADSASSVVTFYTHQGAVDLYHAARYADAESMCNQAIAAIERAHGPKSPELAAPLNDLATVYMRLCRFADARVAIVHAESVLDPAIPAQALLLARIGINKGWRLYSLGETDAARKVFEDSRELIEKNQKGDSVDLAELINNLALMYEDTATENEDEAQLALARRMLLQAWQMRRKLTGDNSPETAESLNNLGMHLLFSPKSAADLDLAMKTLHQSLDASIKVYGEQNPETAMSHTNLALALLAQGDSDGAEREIHKAMPVTLHFLGENSQDRAFQLTTLGRILQEQTHYEQAEKYFVEAVAINERIFGPSDPSVVTALQYLQKLYETAGDTSKENDIERRIEKISGKGI